MNRRIGALMLMGILGGCSSAASLCDGGAGPETVVVDASAFATPGSELEVCFAQNDDRPDAKLCNPPGSSEVGQTWHGEFPDAVNYEVARANPDGTVDVLIDGTYRLQCLPGTVRLELAGES